MTSARTKTKKHVRDQQRAWVRWLSEQMRLSASELAVKAGMADVTLTRFLNREDYEGALSPLTVRLLTEFTGLPGPDAYLSGGRAAGFEEASEFDYKAEDNRGSITARLIEVALTDRPNASPKILQTRALEEHGYFPGDILIVDQSTAPMPGDVVAAQVYDRRGGAQTVYRVFSKAGALQFLLPPPDDPQGSLHVDAERVLVVGVVTESIRQRQTRAA